MRCDCRVRRFLGVTLGGLNRGREAKKASRIISILSASLNIEGYGRGNRSGAANTLPFLQFSDDISGLFSTMSGLLFTFWKIHFCDLSFLSHVFISIVNSMVEGIRPAVMHCMYFSAMI